MYGGEGKIFYPEIEQDQGGKTIKVHTAEEWRGGNSLKRKRANHEEGRGEIKDPGGGEDIDIGGLHPNFEKCVDTLVTHEVQELKHHRGIKEDAEETRKRQRSFLKEKG